MRGLDVFTLTPKRTDVRYEVPPGPYETLGAQDLRPQLKIGARSALEDPTYGVFDGDCARAGGFHPALRRAFLAISSCTIGTR
jgi:hypothetical protein